MEGRGGESRREEEEEKGDIHPYKDCIGMFYYVLWLGQHLS